MNELPCKRRIPSTPGIYLILSKMDSRRYVGSAVNLKARHKGHSQGLRKGSHENPRLRNFFNKYGYGSLEFFVIQTCNKSDLITREQFFIDRLKPEFNIHLNARSPLGVQHTIRTRFKLRKALKGLRKGCKSPMEGKHHDETAKAKMSAAAKLRKLSEETRRKIGESLKGRPCPTAGRPLSEEHKAKLRETSSKHRHTQETKDKMSRAHRGKVRSPEHCAGRKLSEEQKAKMRGRKLPEETKRKIGVSGKLAWIARKINLTSGDLAATTAALVFTGVGVSGGSCDQRDYSFIFQRVSGQTIT